MWTYIPKLPLTYSPVTAASILPSDSLESNPEPCAMSSGTSTANRSSASAKSMDSWMTRRSSGETSENSMDSPGVEEWISLVPRRHVNHTVKPANCVDPQIRAISSQIPSESLARYSPEESMWRPCQVLMFDQRMDGQPTGQLWSENWPRSGTTVDGTLYQRRTLAHRISENGGGLWPTPVADGDRTTNYKQGATSLGFAARWSIPTPTPSDNWTGNLESSQQSEGSMHSVTLPGFVQRFPTPSTMDHIERKGMRPSRAATNRTTGYLSEEVTKWPTPTGDDTNNVTRASGDFQSLSREAQLWPTPATSQNYKPVRPLAPSEANGTHGTMLVGAVGDRHPDHIGGKLSATWVEWLMGIPEGWSALEPLAEGAYEEWAGHMSQGTWWAEERGLPRLAERQTDRVNRLKCLGNGVVPASGALAFITLEGEA